MNQLPALAILVACALVWGCFTCLQAAKLRGTHPSITQRESLWHQKTSNAGSSNAASLYASRQTANVSTGSYVALPNFATLHSFDGSSANGSRRLLPLPVQVVDQYVTWHSVDALRRQPHNRSFSVVFYSCPLQAGNRLHHFLSGFYWSIVTNRTMLWKYWDMDTCSMYGATYNPNICREANAVTDCDPILTRAKWIPSYDEWREKLPQLQQQEPPLLQLPFYATHPRRTVDHHFQWGPGNDEQTQGVDVRYVDAAVVAFAQTRFKITFMTRERDAHDLLHSTWGRDANARLHRHGVDFWHGMLQRYSWDFTPRIMEARKTTHSYLQLPDSERGSYYSIALHSRHIDPTDDGCDVSREQACVSQLLARRDSALEDPRSANSTRPRPCAVHVLSDRSCTLSRLVEWLPNTVGCQALVASHDARTDFLSEHGPFAGAGFFQDWALASAARSAFVGLRRSSSDLIRELLVFERGREAWIAALQAGVDALDGLEAALDRAQVDICFLSDVI